MDAINRKSKVAEFAKKYKPQMEALLKLPIHQYKSLNEDDVYGLGKMLEQADTMFEYAKMNESAAPGTAATLGALPVIAKDIITASYGTSIIPVVCDIQPLDDIRGLIYYKKLRVARPRGNMAQGDLLFDTQEMPSKYPEGFTSDTTYESMQKDGVDVWFATANFTVPENITGTTAGDVTATSPDTMGTTTFTTEINHSIAPKSIKVSFEIWELADDAASGKKVLKNQYAISSKFSGIDDGNGSIMGTYFSGTATYGKQDGMSMTTPDESKSVITLQFANGGALAEEVKALTADGTRAVKVIFQVSDNFETEGNAALPEIMYENATKTIDARVFALTQRVGLLQSYQMQKRFNRSIEEEMTEDLVNTMTMDVGGAVLTELVRGCKMYRPLGKENDRNFSNSITYNVNSYQLPKLQNETLVMKFEEANSKIYQQAGRGQGNIIMAAPQAIAKIRSLEGFKPTATSSIQGPHVVGTVHGMTVIMVPTRVRGFEDLNSCYIMYKGTGQFDSPAVYAPYMPLYVSGSIPVINNPMMKQGMVCTMAGINCVAPQFLTQIVFRDDINPIHQLEPFPVNPLPLP